MVLKHDERNSGFDLLSPSKIAIGHTASPPLALTHAFIIFFYFYS
jgi:hypothetical protein